MLLFAGRDVIKQAEQFLTQGFASTDSHDAATAGCTRRDDAAQRPCVLCDPASAAVRDAQSGNHDKLGHAYNNGQGGVQWHTGLAR